MKTAIARLALVLVLLTLVVSPVLALADLPAALDYLETQQNADGGFGNGFTPDSALGSTADVLLAILALDGDPAAFVQGGNTPLTYLSTSAPAAAGSGDLSKLILALVAAGENPRLFGGVDSVDKLEALAGADGRIGGAADTFVSTLMSVIALKSVERPVSQASLELIRTAQQDDGGWAWDGSASTPSDTNTTAYAVQALLASGEPAGGDAVAKALAYYEGIQNDDGGWPYQNPSDYGTATDANSTAVTVQALLAAGEDPAEGGWTSALGTTPYDALDALQNGSGAWSWKADAPGDNLLATVQAAPARAGKALLLATMSVGEAASLAPATVPVTGGPGVDPAWLLTASGLALALGGILLRARKR
ncbi:MAG TPA: prenyltransferase/squalene oxidase repeat-containing protein [Anaerolineae bacterium]|nr:prenyltransferase/squalene oxidase repeat-containing protein [Anaerolineae bacterium]